MLSEDKKELIVNCHCGCENTIHIKIDDEDKDYDSYAFLSYLNSNWYRDQDDMILRVIGRKIKKIWAILRNKDFYYSEVNMTYSDLQKFKEFVNQF